MQVLTTDISGVQQFIPHNADSVDTRPSQKKWERDEYYRLVDLGFFEGKHVELLQGEIIEMAPMGSSHITIVMILGDVLRDVFGKDFYIRTQGTLDLGNDAQPEPDAAVITGSVRDYASNHPTTAVLVIEVSDTTLSIDRNIKSAIYARNAINEYWIVNVQDRCLEVYRKPVDDPNLGFIYSERTVLGEDQTVSPLAEPNAKIMIADLLP